MLIRNLIKENCKKFTLTSLCSDPIGYFSTHHLNSPGCHWIMMKPQPLTLFCSTLVFLNTFYCLENIHLVWYYCLRIASVFIIKLWKLYSESHKGQTQTSKDRKLEVKQRFNSPITFLLLYCITWWIIDKSIFEGLLLIITDKLI